jgi:non-specific serine/threonine protein kinase
MLELILTPAGRLRLRTSEAQGEAVSTSPALGEIARAFDAHPAAGLVTLAAARVEPSWSPALLYWRDFAAHYLGAFCQAAPVSGAAIEPLAAPAEAELATWVLRVPPMPGAEYASPNILAGLWADLDAWVRQEAGARGGVAAFLQHWAPLWHQVGRVCLHLAENRRDSEYPFAFLATYTTGMGRGSRVQHQPLNQALQEFAGVQNKAALIRLLEPLQRASEQSALVRELVDSRDIYHPLAWNPREAYRLLKDIPILEAAGLTVRVPDWWARRPRPLVRVTLGEKSRQALGAESLLAFRVGVALGDQALSEAEWQALLAAQEGLVWLKGQWVEVDREKLTQALKHWKHVEREVASGGLSFHEGMRLLAGAPTDLRAEAAEAEARAWTTVEAGGQLKALLDRLRDPAVCDPLESGAIHGILRSYQRTGTGWLGFLSGLGLGACLADDMGLGKTLQALALLLARVRERPSEPSLILLPASLLSNWKAEIARFAPELRALYLHPSELDRAGLAAAREARGRYDVVLTTYGMLTRSPWLAEVAWDLAILDEAQAIKNPSARQTRAVKGLKSRARIALTGTPMENRLGDLWSLFDFLNPGLLGGATRFRDFVRGLERREPPDYAPLRNLVRPYILRRLKTDKTVAPDLPDKTEVRVFCGLSKVQAALYQRAVDELSHTLAGQSGMARRGLILAFLVRFKQICNHPSQLTGDGGYRPEASAKFLRLQTLCEEIAGRQEKALVFTQFREIADPLAEFLAGVFGRPGLVLHGGVAVGKRRGLVEAFQREEGPPFFVLSVRAGGLGLNLTEAAHVIHFDRWWNPAVENQATDRAFRIGQHKNVLVHKFVCHGTVEERIDAMLEEKRALAEEVLAGGAETLLTEMSDAEVLRLVALDVEKADV